MIVYSRGTKPEVINLFSPPSLPIYKIQSQTKQKEEQSSVEPTQNSPDGEAELLALAPRRGGCCRFSLLRYRQGIWWVMGRRGRGVGGIGGLCCGGAGPYYYRLCRSVVKEKRSCKTSHRRCLGSGGAAVMALRAACSADNVIDRDVGHVIRLGIGEYQAIISTIT